MRIIWFIVVVFAAVDLSAMDRTLPQLIADYDVYDNVIYFEDAGQKLTADIFVVKERKKNPVLVYFHGGGWVYNTRHKATLMLLPYLQKGFNVINVSYRKIDSARAPAAVVDATCVLRWIALNADRYGFDVKKIITSGNSAGGHLAMMAAYSSRSKQFDGPCWNGQGPDVAAVVNWYGISDVRKMLADGEDPHAYAIQWLGDAEDPVALANRLSPINYLAPASSPTLSIHGTQDQVVLFNQSEVLHAKLLENSVFSRLHKVDGKGHGDFSSNEFDAAFDAIWSFLEACDVLPEPSVQK